MKRIPKKEPKFKKYSIRREYHVRGESKGEVFITQDRIIEKNVYNKNNGPEQEILLLNGLFMEKVVNKANSLLQGAIDLLGLVVYVIVFIEIYDYIGVAYFKVQKKLNRARIKAG